MHGKNDAPQFILLAYDPLSSLAYPMITHGSPVASNMPISKQECEIFKLALETHIV